MAVAVLEGGGNVVGAERDAGSANERFEIANGKAHGGPAIGSRATMTRAETTAVFSGRCSIFDRRDMVPRSR